jgi:DNA-binding response OmpR family regulator
MKKTILVVDDDPDILEAMRYLLESSGYYTITDRGDNDLLPILERQRPAVILLDILLSGKDGREICKELKQNTKTKNIPIIMISAHTDAVNTIKDCGAEDFIAKPFDIDELVERVAKFTT